MGISLIEHTMKAFVISALVAVAAARPDVSSHAVISHGHGPVVSHAVHAPHHGAVVHHAAPLFHHAAPVIAPPAPYHPAPAYGEKGEPAPYAYEYGVADDYSKAQFNAAETADPSGNVAGSYSVALPDGRTQHVKYTADHVNGYVAEVTYEGVPVYPEEKPYAPAPAYHA